MTGDFLLFRKNTAIKSYSMRGHKISEELKRLSEVVYQFVKKTTYVKYYFKYIHNRQASKFTKNITTLHVFYV